MELSKLLDLYSDLGCTQLYAKELPKNANSKNQVYLGGSLEAVNILPSKEITVSEVNKYGTTSQKTKKENQTLWAFLDYYWVNESGELCKAPYTKLVLYPQYPEVRLSGFLRGCLNPPSDLMGPTTVGAGRMLFFGVDYSNKKIYAYIAASENPIINDLKDSKGLLKGSIFFELSIRKIKLQLDERWQLLTELKRIHSLGNIKSKRLSKSGEITDCTASQCGGYTLEAELGIIPNAIGLPDYLGYEVKSFTVKSFKNINSGKVTLMTPEPDIGFYAENGTRAFIEKFGYADVKGIPDRFNFGGTYKVGKKWPRTKLRTELIGFDISKSKITDTLSGMIALIDEYENIAAGWSFVKLIDHWSKKHNKAVYVPNIKIVEPMAYQYSSKIVIGHSTEFSLFLKQMAEGRIYLDPALKLENKSTEHSKIKARNQFRINTGSLGSIYKENEVIDLLSI